ncbi:STAS domain-containing protein [Paractinoplanes rishiriensis]|uniref:STAS domain-containing protein n=1 Tax=Paractinoplanes rishiriensis TaxID=1050105 RepID=A0A919K967_9ACTN|nr:STAS domain-containing protein [Actinoplanes rishiriensis]GIF01141.1 hypothetical protein Ari01nite_86050 [Actinoplanes rishiriensis]
MHISITSMNPARSRLLMRLTGDIDLAVADRLRLALTTTLAAKTVNELLVDLSAATFLDCTGVTALLDGRRAALGLSKRYDITGASGTVLRVLQLTGVLPGLAYTPPRARGSRTSTVAARPPANVSRGQQSERRAVTATDTRRTTE